MKLRLDFVTNSSSSSYVCEVCGAEEYAWERPEWMVICENEHSFCVDHKLVAAEEDEDGYIPDSTCPICNFVAYSQNEMAAYLLKTRHIPREEVFAEVKKANKRRKVLYNSEYITYVMGKFNLTEDIVMDEIRTKFATWEEYVSYKGE